MRERTLARAAIAGFAVGVIGLAVVATTSGDDAPARLPALSLGGATGAEDRAATLSLPAGAIEYRVRGDLPELPGRARAWALGRDGDASRVETLARALGLDAPVTADADGWIVSSSGRSLRVARQPGLPWHFGPDAGGQDGGCVVAPAQPGAPRPGPDTPVASDECGSSTRLAGGGVIGSAGSAPSTGSGGSDGSAASAPTGSASATATTIVCPPPCPPGARCATASACAVPAPVPEPERPADLPTREQAEAAGRALLAKAGVALGGARVRVEDWFSQWRVEVDPEVGGLPTVGFSTGVSVGAEGVIEGADGWLAQPDPGEEYPLVTAADGLARLKESPFGIGPRPLVAQAFTCAGCEAGTPLVRTITGVRVGLAFAPLLEPENQDRALLVPVLLFDIEDGGTVPVLAVADEFLPEPVPDDEPRPEPGPVTTEPAIEPAPATTTSSTSSTTSTTARLPE